jgi:hypothetical protein
LEHDLSIPGHVETEVVGFRNFVAIVVEGGGSPTNGRRGDHRLPHLTVTSIRPQANEDGEA